MESTTSSKSSKSAWFLLASNFVEYFNDNVIMMLAAAAVGSFTTGAAGQIVGENAGSVAQAAVSLAACTLLMMLLRWAMVAVYSRAREEGTVRHVILAMLSGIPWFARVPLVVFVAAGLNSLYDEVAWSHEEVNHGAAGKALLINIAALVFCFLILLASGWAGYKLPSVSSTETKWYAVLLQTLYLGMGSGTGKVLHYTVRCITLTMAGPLPGPPSDPSGSRLAAQGSAAGVLTLLAWHLMASDLPNQMSSTNIQKRPFTVLQLGCQQYVMCYAWAFAVVNFLWEVLHGYCGSRSSHVLGLVLFSLSLVPVLLVALLLADSAPYKSFSEMGTGHPRKAAAAFMTFFMVDDITWWAGAQIVASFDTEAEDLGQEGRLKQSTWPIIAANFALSLALLFLGGVVHAMNVAALTKRASGSGGGYKSTALGENIRTVEEMVGAT